MTCPSFKERNYSFLLLLFIFLKGKKVLTVDTVPYRYMACFQAQRVVPGQPEAAGSSSHVCEPSMLPPPASSTPAPQPCAQGQGVPLSLSSADRILKSS